MTAHPTGLVANAVDRVLSRMFPGYFTASTKHDHYVDFGWPETVGFQQFYRMYCRNSLASAAIDRTVAKTWETAPEVWQSDKPAETLVEGDIRQRFTDLRMWQKLAEADRRGLVGKYAGVILRLRDDRQFHEPVDRVPGGLDGLAEIIPAWEGQLTVSSWDMDLQSEDYGKPTMFQFNESAVGDNDQPRSFNVHPDRVVIWSEDGSVNGRSALEPGFNDLIDMEKIKGAGGEGFWKTSRGAPVIEAPQGVTPAQVAEGMGVNLTDLSQAINDQVDDFQKGFDKGLLLGGMTAKPMTITLPQPEEFLAGPLHSFAASMLMPVKILIGNQNGERASTEDAREWAQTCNSRRVNYCVPLIRDMLDRLERWGMIPEQDWTIHWSDLTEASASEKVERAGKLADINTKTQPGDDPAFSSDEIRQAAGYEALIDTDSDG